MEDSLIPNDIETVEVARAEQAIIIRDDPKQQLRLMKERAECAAELLKFQSAIIVAATDASDWIQFGDKMCLSSAGAERIAQHFDIRLTNWKQEKEEWQDELGRGYRYIFTCTAGHGNRQLHAIGQCDSRDKFLCKVGDTYKSLTEINANNLRAAAYHRCQGNAIKALLGIRGITKSTWEALFKATGKDTTVTNKATFKKGSKGGTSKTDTDKQAELGAILLGFVDEGFVVELDEEGNPHLEPAEYDDVDRLKAASDSCAQISSFVGKDNDLKAGKESLKDLRGKWLDVTLAKAKKLKAEGYKDEG
ncbi:MAG TPA: hypothetical protein ENH94_06280 [Phycisphaerales bacterium]|nr:hypothetical protein [Phycisphaerales bacterium]